MVSNRPGDIDFWWRIQRTLSELNRLKQKGVKGRDRKKRQQTFFQDADLCHKRLELFREIFLQSSNAVKPVCLRYGLSLTSYYRLVKDYRLFGPWALIPANTPGKDTMSDETELSIVPAIVILKWLFLLPTRTFFPIRVRCIYFLYYFKMFWT
ncbi:hypothetical protein [Desulfosarcina ovata]|uniref:hypothetical protein n=1 Tax=Desulfosarcina ovata TaxID=83564 RepID=UPI0012D341DA|nr:hypothetical protein [Desulfosarcina ovata]